MHDTHVFNLHTAFTPNVRQQAIVEEVKRHGAVTIESLSSRSDVTLQTVRRDVQRLAEFGFLARFYGGGCMPASTTDMVN